MGSVVLESIELWPSVDKPDPSCLSLKSRQDIHNDVDKVVQDIKHRFSTYNRYFVEGYEQSILCMVLNCGSSNAPSEFDLLFDAIPNGIDGHADEGAFPFHIAEHGSKRDGEQLVFVCDRYFVKCPEKIVPSLVRLVRTKYRVKFFRDVFTPSLNGVIEFDNTASKGEGSVLRVDSSSSYGQAVPSVIECRAEVVHSISSQSRKRIRQGPIELELVNLMPRLLRVKLYRHGVRACLEEDSRLPFEVRNVCLRASNLPA